MYLRNNYSNFRYAQNNEQKIKKIENLIKKHQPEIPENQLINRVKIQTTSVARTLPKN